MGNKRLYEIDRAKGLAIFLVVLGHIVARNAPNDNGWYSILKLLIYEFHMPFFMYLSGVIFYYTYQPINTVSEYKLFISKKALRLLPGFIMFGALILIGKEIASNFIFVDNTAENLITGFIDIFLVPAESAAGSLWFIYVLFQFYIIFPLLLKISKYNMSILVLICSVLYVVPSTKYFMLNRVFEYAIFFGIGIAIMSYYETYKLIIKKHGSLFIALFVISFFILPITHDSTSKLIIGICSIPALQLLVDSPLLKRSKILFILGIYTYSIYLMNTIAIGLTKGILFEFTEWDGNNFLFFAPVLLISGIVMPIIIKKYLLSKSTYFNRITN